MNKPRSPIDRNIETAVHELLDSRAEARIYIYLLRKNGARSEEIIRGTRLHPSTVRELLSKMHENKIIFRQKIKTDRIGKNPYKYGAVSPIVLLQRRVKIIESRLNKIANLSGKTESTKYVHIMIGNQGGEQ
ncbi:MAG: TrmB family transcriptional regulator [Thermoplasmata archaeon M9B2D]|nr:MAG: TrmB family transcriptional regulator [Thermoplasmata archaeon M9B2D]PNX54075.1 MAG: TrmB family transcriptional regulator [Thermoplasmata archaeon M9B2D]